MIRRQIPRRHPIASMVTMALLIVKRAGNSGMPEIRECQKFGNGRGLIRFVLDLALPRHRLPVTGPGRGMSRPMLKFAPGDVAGCMVTRPAPSGQQAHRPVDRGAFRARHAASLRHDRHRRGCGTATDRISPSKRAGPARRLDPEHRHPARQGQSAALMSPADEFGPGYRDLRSVSQTNRITGPCFHLILFGSDSRTHESPRRNSARHVNMDIR